MKKLRIVRLSWKKAFLIKKACILTIFGTQTIIYKRAQSDHGTEFQGAVKVFFKRCRIQYITSRAYHPQAQGKIERSHGKAN